MVFSDKLILIGYWNDRLQDGSLLGDGSLSEDYALYPSPLDLISPGWLSSEKSSLISYLRSGAIHRMYFGGSTCRFLCENKSVGNKELTDGVWVWPEGLAHYVEVHDVLLPSEFVNQARNNGFLISADVISAYERIWKKNQTYLSGFSELLLDISGPSTGEVTINPSGFNGERTLPTKAQNPTRNRDD